MSHSATRPILESFSALAGVPIRLIADLPPAIASEIARVDESSSDGTTELLLASGRYMSRRFDPLLGSIIVAGPFRHDCDDLQEIPTIGADQVGRITTSLVSLSDGLGRIQREQRERIELASQFELMSSAIIAISGELALDTVLKRIVDLARGVAGAKYAALGVPDERGELVSFITSGMTRDEVQRIGDLPRGHGVLGALIRDRVTIRVPVLSEHPDSVGFPPNHPPMRSFLGVPIIAFGTVLGNLYLTEKRFAPEFTEEDARLVELLARHAAVAIENARLYERLGSQQRRLEFMVDQLPEAVIFFEREPNRVAIANRQASYLLGWDIIPPLSLEEFVGRNPRFDQDGHPIPVDEIPLVRSLLFGETIHRSEVHILRPDGGRLTLLVNSAPLRSRESEIIGAIVVFQDITQIKDAEQLKDDFLSLVSHELRTPLTTLHGGAHLLMNSGGALDETSTLEILTDMYGESQRLSTLVENMVQLANIRAGRFRIDAEPVHLSMLIRRAIAAVKELSGGREFRTSVAEDALASGDNGSLDQVVRNLLQNALKYVPDESPIDVEAQTVGDLIEVSVRDYGEGIDHDDVPLLFDRFQRGKQRDRTAGMGLGLYLCRQIIEAHGGSIWVEAPHDGGSRFVFTVPAIRDDEFM